MSKKIHWFKFHFELLHDPRVTCLMTERNGEGYIFFYLNLVEKACILRDHGYVYATKGKALTNRQLAIGYHRNARFVRKALDVLEEYEFIRRDENGVIQILDWRELQGVDLPGNSGKKGVSQDEEAAAPRTGKTAVKKAELEDNTEANTTATADDVIEVIDTRDLTETADVTTYAEDESASTTTMTTEEDTTHTDSIVPATVNTPAPDTTATEDATTNDTTHTDVIVPATANTPEPATTDLNQPADVSHACSEVNGQHNGLTFEECGSKSLVVWAYTEAFGSIAPEVVRELEELEAEEGTNAVAYCVWLAEADQNNTVDYIASLVEEKKQQARLKAKANEETNETNTKGDFSSVGETINAQFGRLIRA